MNDELKREPCADGEECPYCMEILEGEYGHRRMCRIEHKHAPTFDTWECTACGAAFTYEPMFDYCPWCGAKVVEE